MQMLGIALAFLTATPASPAAERRTWRVERASVTFELTRDDLRAWTGNTAGPLAFSIAALLDAEKKEFDRTAAELAREIEAPGEDDSEARYVMDESMTFEVMSVVGPLVAYRETSGSSTPGAAHPTRYEIHVVRDVSRPDATASLLDFYSEHEIVRALKADRFVRAFGDPEKGFESAATLDDLIASLDPEYARRESDEPGGDCGFEVSFGSDMMKHFYFHDLVKEQVAVRVAVAPGNEWCNRVSGRQYLGLLLPIPAALRDDLLKARRGEAGFLAAGRRSAGALTWTGDWEMDLWKLARPGPSPRP